MAIVFPTTDVISDATAIGTTTSPYAVASGDLLKIKAGLSVVSRFSSGISFDGLKLSVDIDGTVTGAGYGVGLSSAKVDDQFDYSTHVGKSGSVTGANSGIFAGAFTDPRRGTVSIVNDGQVTGFNDAGIYVQYTKAANVTNNGSVSAFGNDGQFDNGVGFNRVDTVNFKNTGVVSNVATVGISLTAGGVVTNFADKVSIYNSGTIQAGLWAIRSDAATFESIINTGQIVGNIDAANLTGGTLTNTGTIYGDIFLNGGADTYDGSSGRLVGKIFGGEGVDKICTGLGSDIIDGGAEADYMAGGAGSDTYYVDNAGDQVIEKIGGGSKDTVLVSSDTYVLAAGQEIEFLATTDGGGTNPVSLSGNEFAQTITANAGNNNLADGRGAGDVLKGLGGNDTYRIASATTTIVEGASEGTTDIVLASVSFTLNAGAYIEFLQTNSTAGTANIFLTGNELAQTLVGNAGANRLDGKGEADTLTGRAGADTFVFSTAPSLGVDTITDFKAVDDTIELSKAVFAALSLGTLSTNAFETNTTGTATDSFNRIIYQTTTGKLFYDADGTGSGSAAVHFATLTGNPTISNLDFVVAA